MDDARIAEVLTAHSVEVNAIDESRQARTVLVIAVARGCTRAVAALLENGADMLIQACVFYRALDVAVQSKRSVKTISVLLANGAEINARDCCSSTVLHHAAERELLDAISTLAVHGDDLDARVQREQIALCAVVMKNTGAAVSVLIDGGTYMNTINETGTMALHYAASSPDRKHTLAALLRHGAVLQDSEEMTPLHCTARHEKIAGVCELLSLDDVVLDLVRDSASNTALDEAVEFDCIEAVELILDKLQVIRDRVNADGIYRQAFQRAMGQHKVHIAELTAVASSSSLVKARHETQTSLSG